MNLQEKVRSSRSRKSAEHSGHVATRGTHDPGNSVPPNPLGNRHKPWPSRKVGGVEEVVKYMSTVPCYLKQMERRDDVQEKALNVGVLDWGRLEKWTYIQKQVANRRCGYSPSSSSASSSSFSTFGSSSQSRKSTGSPLAQRKQSPSFNDHWYPSVKERRSKIIKEESSGFIISNSDSKTSLTNTSTGQSLETDKTLDSGLTDISYNKSRHAEVGSLISPRDYAVSTFEHHKVKTQTSISTETEFQSCEPESCLGGLHPGNGVQEQYSAVEGMWDHLQESVCGGHISFESALSKNEVPEEVDHNSLSGRFLHQDVHFYNIYPHLPHSCPLPPANQIDEPSISNRPDTASKIRHEKHEQFSGNSSDKFLVDSADSFSQDEMKADVASIRGQSPCRTSSGGPNWISRSSSWRESLSGKEMKQAVCSDNCNEDKTASNSRGRRSPLRRMIDPLLKSKNRMSFSGPITSSLVNQTQEVSNTDQKLPNREELRLAKGSCKSSDTNTGSSASQVTSSKDSVRENMHIAARRQALLKLAWKNGLPLFMLSFRDNNILAATMVKSSTPCKNDLECVYTIFIAHEVKKKGGVWISQGKKDKKNGLVYTVVGQMRVSCSKSTRSESTSHAVVRQFVLFGNELVPRTHELGTSLFSNELAAIVVNVPDERPEHANDVVLQSSICRDSSQKDPADRKCTSCEVATMKIEQGTNDSSLSNLTAILPRGVHGSSPSSVPSALIERWKSGGSCDCGGWDEGCMLTILTNNDQDRKNSCSVGASQTTDGTHRIELFIQGGARENRHGFSMIAFKEGLYTVDFGSSMAPLQAFAICIATVHCRKFVNPSELHYSVEAKSLQEQIFADYTRMAPERSQAVPTCYVPHHPPLSPVGRA